MSIDLEKPPHPLEQLRAQLGLASADFYGALNIPLPTLNWYLSSKNAVNSSVLDRIYAIWGIDADQVLLGTVEIYEVLPRYLMLFNSQLRHVQTAIVRVAEELHRMASFDGTLQTPVCTKKLPGSPGMRFKAARESTGWSVRRTSAEFHLGRRSVDEIENQDRPIPEAVLRAAWTLWGVLPGNIVHGFHRAAVLETEDTKLWQILAALPPRLRLMMLRMITVSGRYSAELDEKILGESFTGLLIV